MTLPDFILIPRQLVEDKKLTPMSKEVYGLIYWMVHMKLERCFASNETFAGLLNTSERSIKRSLDLLEKRGHITRLYKDSAKRNRTEILANVSFGFNNEGRTGHSTRDISVPRGILLNNIYTPAVGKLSNKHKKMKPNKLGKYTETLSSDAYEDVIDSDTREEAGFPAKETINLKKFYDEMLEWAYHQTGKRFTNVKKQYRALKEMRELGLSVREVRELFTKMQNDKFWKDKQFDFMTVRSMIKMI